MTIRIGQEHYGYVYELKQTVLGGVWVCRRGSDWSQADEKLILVREDEYPRSTTAAIIYSIRTCLSFIRRNSDCPIEARSNAAERSRGELAERSRFRIRGDLTSSASSPKRAMMIAHLRTRCTCMPATARWTAMAMSLYGSECFALHCYLNDTRPDLFDATERKRFHATSLVGEMGDESETKQLGDAGKEKDRGLFVLSFDQRSFFVERTLASRGRYVLFAIAPRKVFWQWLLASRNSVT